MNGWTHIPARAAGLSFAPHFTNSCNRMLLKPSAQGAATLKLDYSKDGAAPGSLEPVYLSPARLAC